MISMYMRGQLVLFRALVSQKPKKGCTVSQDYFHETMRPSYICTFVYFGTALFLFDKIFVSYLIKHIAFAIINMEIFGGVPV